MTTALIVEDDSRLRAELAFLLRDEGIEVTAVESAEEAFDRLTTADPLPGFLLLDVRLPGESGVDLVRRLAQEKLLPPTVVMSGEASIGEAVEALKLGVHDFLEKPFHRERLLQTIRIMLEKTALRQRLERLEGEFGLSTAILGESLAIQSLKELITQVAASGARVLIRGESGSGKELVADAIHAGSDRCDGPLVKINCAAIPPQLVEDELFGHVRGAFTDASGDKRGLFEEANGGTLFLDEIGDMDLDLQARLLRVLEDGRVRRIGGREEIEVDVRVIAATHENLEEAVAEKRFRQDLYYRLAHLPVDVPPLRAREDDVRTLFEHFLAVFCDLNNRPRPHVEEDVFANLSNWAWPGNVRELKSLAERLAVLAADPIDCKELPEPYRSGRPASEVLLNLDTADGTLSLKEFRNQCEKRYVEAVLESSGWNVSEAARRLGIHRTRLHQKMNELGTRRA
jgi:DNA-binding NtrC family response regulator